MAEKKKIKQKPGAKPKATSATALIAFRVSKGDKAEFEKKYGVGGAKLLREFVKSKI